MGWAAWQPWTWAVLRGWSYGVGWHDDFMFRTPWSLGLNVNILYLLAVETSWSCALGSQSNSIERPERVLFSYQMYTWACLLPPHTCSLSPDLAAWSPPTDQKCRFKLIPAKQGSTGGHLEAGRCGKGGNGNVLSNSGCETLKCYLLLSFHGEHSAQKLQRLRTATSNILWNFNFRRTDVFKFCLICRSGLKRLPPGPAAHTPVSTSSPERFCFYFIFLKIKTHSYCVLGSP